MENNQFAYMVYENWTIEIPKAVVHRRDCTRLRTGPERLTSNNNSGPNDRWYGFNSFGEAVAFAALLPNRRMKSCSYCKPIEMEE